MLDINLIRENPEAVRKALLKRLDEADFTDLIAGAITRSARRS